MLLSILIYSIENKSSQAIYYLLGDLAESLGYIYTVATHFNNTNKAITRTLTF